MATTADFRTGLCMEFNNELYTIVDFQHVKPGKGGAFVRTKIKSLKTGRVIVHTFNAGVKIDIARVERRPYQFLYKDNNGHHFMHTQTFDQIAVSESIINAPQFLKEGQEVEILVHADTESPLSCELPNYVELLVTYAEPGARGDTANKTLKPSTVETGATVNVPLFVNEGDKIKIDSVRGTYSERVK